MATRLWQKVYGYKEDFCHEFHTTFFASCITVGSSCEQRPWSASTSDTDYLALLKVEKNVAF